MTSYPTPSSYGEKVRWRRGWNKTEYWTLRWFNKNSFNIQFSYAWIKSARRMLNTVFPVVLETVREKSATGKGYVKFRFQAILGKAFTSNIYLFKVDNRDTRKKHKICSKLTIKTPEQRQGHVFLLTFNIFHASFVALLLTLNR